GVLKNANLDKIATAHTLDDQAETVLLKLARGAGTRGLAGIYPKISLKDSALSTHKNKGIVRPLLSTRRQHIEAYLHEIKQTWREDSSNRELRHRRNRVRHELLPRLEEHLNPRIRESLAEAAEIARCEEEYWSSETARLLPQIWKAASKGGSLSRVSMAQLNLAVQRRIVSAIGESLSLNLEFQHVEEILALSQESASTALPHGWSAALSRGKISFKPRSNKPPDYEYALPVPGKVAIPEADAIIEAASVRQKDSQYATERLLDKQFTAKGLVVRNWRPGDRFWPPNTKAPKKIKELLQERHLTGDEKKNWPVVASGNEVVWVRGLGVRRDYEARDPEGVLITASAIEA
ncbi:MAG TPA: tRNA lysidine(34) synthetase TilS, partial [Terriglobales bacterium]|nr:tRNA lysidine(34) synthetase TilS [Terriglobales bacterium]